MKKLCIYDSFDDLPAAYASLFDAAERSGGIFLGRSWFQHLAAHSFDPDTRLRLYGVESNTEPASVHAALVMRFQPRAPGWLAPNTLYAASNYYASLFSPVLNTAASDMKSGMDEDLRLLMQAVGSDAQGWDAVDMRPMAQDSPIFASCLRALHAAGMIPQTYFCFGNWYLQVQGRSYQEYFASLPSRLRNTVQRKSRQLESAGRVSIDIVTGPERLETTIQAYQQIYLSSWKGPEFYPNFIPGLIRQLAAEGKLRLGVAYVDQQPAAAQLWIVSEKTASIYKLAYDEQFAELSIGSILTARMMQQAIDTDRVDTVDYLTGDEPYKQDWMSHRRERWGIIAFKRSSARGMLAAARHIGGRLLKRYMRQVINAGKNLLRTLSGQSASGRT